MDTGAITAVVVKEASRLSRRHMLEASLLAGLSGGCAAVGTMILDSSASLFTRAGLEHLGTAFALGFFSAIGIYLKGLYRSLPESWDGEERRE